MISKTYQRYIWLLDTLLNSSPLTFEEIVRLWHEHCQGESDLPLRTFHEHRKGVKEMFGVDIACDKSKGFVYYVKNPEALNDNKLGKWLLNAYSVPEDFTTYSRMKDRILLEDIPRGKSFVNPIIDAMQRNVELDVDYQKYEGHREDYHVQPYALRVCNRHWYLLGYIHEKKSVRHLALDRMIDLRVSKTTFELPEGFDARKYYSDCVGVFMKEDSPVREVRICAYGVQMEHLRSLPLHKSQREVKTRYGEFAEFTYRLCITPELISQLLSMGENVEVLEPEDLRNEIKKRLKRCLTKYN